MASTLEMERANAENSIRTRSEPFVQPGSDRIPETNPKTALPAPHGELEHAHADDVHLVRIDCHQGTTTVYIICRRNANATSHANTLDGFL